MTTVLPPRFKPSSSRYLQTIARLALWDLRYEWQLAFCAVLGVAVVLTPLLVVFSLKYGIVTALIERLKKDPHNLELRIQGHGHYTADWVEQLNLRPEIEFAIPNTRFLNATLHVRNSKHRERPYANLELVPTADGDPLLSDNAPQLLTEIVLSRSAADALKVVVGDSVLATVRHLQNQVAKRQRIELQVMAVLPPERYQRQAALITLPLLVAIERYREKGIGAPELGWTGTADTYTPPYASFRVYAKTIDDVLPMRNWLAEQGIKSRVRASEIELVKQLDENLTLLFLLLAGLSSLGFLSLMVTTQWASVARKQRDLSVLQLLGFDRYAIAFFPLVQAIVVSAAGSLTAFGLFFAAHPMINHLFAERLRLQEGVSDLLPLHFLIALGFTLLFSVLAASLAAWRTTKIMPAEGLRDD